MDMIRQNGFVVTALPSRSSVSKESIRGSGSRPAHAHWLDRDWETDAQQTSEILSRLRPDLLVVDHYALDRNWEVVQREYCRRIMVIDDLADRRHDCDFLLDQNLGRETQDYSSFIPEKCEVLLGPRFALLRPEFAAFRQYSLNRRQDPQLQHILITMGGVDRHNATSQVLDGLKTCPLSADCEVTVIMGSQAP